APGTGCPWADQYRASSTSYSSLVGSTRRRPSCVQSTTRCKHSHRCCALWTLCAVLVMSASHTFHRVEPYTVTRRTVVQPSLTPQAQSPRTACRASRGRPTLRCLRRHTASRRKSSVALTPTGRGSRTADRKVQWL